MPPGQVDEVLRSNCPYCGAEVVGRNRMCLVHIVCDPDWAMANRMMCDGIHRGSWAKVPERVDNGWAMPEVFPTVNGYFNVSA